MKTKIRLEIWAKILIIVFTFVMVVTAVFGQVSYKLFEKSLTQREEHSNLSEAKYKSNQLEQVIQTLIQKSTTLAKSLQTDDGFSLTDKQVLGLEIWNLETNSLEKSAYNFPYMLSNNILESDLTTPNKKVKWNQKVTIQNISNNGKSLGVIAVPFIQVDNKVTHFLLVNFDIKLFQKLFQEDQLRISFFTNSNNQIISHSNEKLIFQKQIESPLILAASPEAGQEAFDKQIQFKEMGRDYIGAFVISPAYDLKVFVQTDTEVILEPAKNIKYQIYYIAGFVLAGAIFIVYLFSTSLTSSITVLNQLVQKVSKGDFTVKSRPYINKFFPDETTDLSENFDKMTVGLLEREKAKNILNKFHGQAITEDLLAKDLKVGGEKKEVVVFFSDMRNFTAYSESHTPEDVVSMLNEYFELMVSVITKHGGTVDKFIGDAIMAVWGVPVRNESDAYNAVMACLEMRTELANLNNVRISRGQAPILIGMGVHAGNAISGIIGSQQKMEYTVIGDTVNATSRLEASTKSFGTDLLISGEVISKLKGSILFETAGKVKVKGKAEALELYKVNGYVSSTGQETIIKTPYSTIEVSSDEKVKQVV